MTTAPKQPHRAEGKVTMSTFTLLIAMVMGSLSTFDFQNVLRDRAAAGESAQKQAFDTTARIRQLIAESEVFGKVDNKSV